VVHYTSERADIPDAFRESAEVLEHPSARAPEPSASPGPGSVLPTPSGGPVIVDAHLNGVALRLLLDTGADRTVISPEALARAGIDVSIGAPVQITGVTGTSPASLVSVQRLDVAGAQVGPLAVVAHAVPGDGLDGLLGRDVLDAFTVTFDAGQNRTILTPR
jgi:predicted aspartyl protease